jgi:hypothetical protein
MLRVTTSSANNRKKCTKYIFEIQQVSEWVSVAGLACNRNKTPLEPKVNFIRANVKLGVNNIPALEGTNETKTSEKPTLWEKGGEKNAKYYVTGNIGRSDETID